MQIFNIATSHSDFVVTRMYSKLRAMWQCFSGIPSDKFATFLREAFQL